MILHFPNLDTLRLALTSGAISETVRFSATRFGFADDGSLWMQPTAKLTEKAEKELRRLGVTFTTESKAPLSQEATHWMQMLPLARDPRAAELGDKTPVLFELTKAGQLAELATEILRLGNDRQSFRWLDDADQAKALLRVVGPPYYSLLRAIDGAGQDGAPMAYREVAPRVWVQVGYTHPLGEHLRPAAGQWLLLRAAHQWTYVPEAKLHDIYEIIDFQIPEVGTAWKDARLPAHFRVPVKLTRSGTPEATELWLLREAGIAQLEELVGSTDNDLLARLAFAVGEKAGERIVLLRVRPSKHAPPVLVLDGIAFRSYLRIPNLFLPIRTALVPPLRRDAVVKLLAGEPTRLTWLVPDGKGGFTPESLPDDAFRPLSEWIDYVLEHEHQAIKTWLSATQFQFEAFICKDDLSKEKRPPKEPAGPKQPKKPERDDAEEPEQDIEVMGKKKPKKEAPFAEAEVNIKPSDLERRLRELEEAYLALKTPLEDPGRQTIWRELARLNGTLNQPGDASACWGNVLWEEPRVSPDDPREWFRLEAKQAPGAAPSTAQILSIVTSDTLTHSNVRLVTAYLIWTSALPTPPADLRSNLNKIQQYLVKHEAFLGVRSLWLAWHAIYHLSGDVLTLARARDRLLERLYLHGLTPELDLPDFLRFTSVQANNRFRLVRAQIVQLRKQVQDWAKNGSTPVSTTPPYIDLIFAFGLARLGDTNEAHALLRKAAEVLANADEIHSWLYAAFEHRVQQALDGKPATARLPEALHNQLAALEHPEFLQRMPEGKQRAEAKQAQLNLRLKIDRFRQRSRILEPHERVETYGRWHGPNADALTRELAQLSDLHDRGEIIQRCEELFNGKRKIDGASKTDVRILIAAVDLAPRLGQAFGEQMLDRVRVQLAKLKDVDKAAELLEKSVFLAAHYDSKDDIQRFVQQLHEVLKDAKGVSREKLIRLIGGSFRSLRKLGLREPVAQLLERLGEIVEAERAAQSAHSTSLVSDQRSKLHCLLLELASAWFFFGEETRACKILDDARDLLLGKELYNTHQADLACAYLSALGQAPMEFALARVMEFFRKAEGIYDVWVTQSHFSLTRLNVVEAMMLAIISDDFTLDREARKRLDDDEFLVRRRIHRDVREALAKTGTSSADFV